MFPFLTKITDEPKVLAHTTLSPASLDSLCLVPKPHYCALPMRFRSRDPGEFVKLFDREGLERRLPGEDRARIIKKSVVYLTPEVDSKVDV